MESSQTEKNLLITVILKYQNSLIYVIALIHILFSFFFVLSGNIPVERCRYLEKGQPLCMEQHYRMFSSYRRPGIPQDVQLTDLGKDRKPYIMVACCDQVLLRRKLF